MTHVPALRTALQDAAERRYGRRRRIRRLAIVLVPAAAVAYALSLGGGSEPRDETVATITPTPTPTVHTVKVEPAPAPPAPAGPPRFVEPKLLRQAAAERLFKAEGSASGKVESAWATPGMQGMDAHVFLFRRGEDHCLSVPDPATSEAGDRGVSCSSPDIWERYGVSQTIGPSYAAVVGPHRPAPTYRAADGSREAVKVAEGGLVALINGAPGSAITLHGPNGKRRTDSFRKEVPSELIHCSNGYMITAPVDRDRSSDPCAILSDGAGGKR